MPRAQTPADALARSVDRRGPNECWPWTGSLVRGYGQFMAARVKQYAHRAALEAALGRPLADGAMACHHCDNRQCCNPAHIYEGTAQTNSDDMVARGRSVRGRRRRDAAMRQFRLRAGEAAVWIDAVDYDAIALSGREVIQRFVDRVDRGDGIDTNTRWLDGVA